MYSVLLQALTVATDRYLSFPNSKVQSLAAILKTDFFSRAPGFQELTSPKYNERERETGEAECFTTGELQRI